ncbi:MAG: hypothetical protein JW732_05155 [Dehalococcoidia bacterium]|nr:hypothetical protein [Dehalococcoidia bacterium]
MALYAGYQNWFEKDRFAYQWELAAIEQLTPNHKSRIEIAMEKGEFAAPLGLEIYMAHRQKPSPQGKA